MRKSLKRKTLGARASLFDFNKIVKQARIDCQKEGVDFNFARWIRKTLLKACK